MGKVKRRKPNLRSSNNPFERKCSCAIHDPTVEYKRLFNVTSKDFKKSDLNKLIEKRLVSKQNVCDNCLNFENGDKGVWEKNVNIEDTKHNDSVTEFQSYKRNIQKQLLEQVISTSFFEEESMEIKDDVSYYMADENRGKCVCVKCSEIYQNSVSKCPNCGYNPNTITDRTILYEGVPSKHPDHPPNVKLGEIIGVNPNGIESVKEVLMNIMTQCDVGNSRQWVRVGCDGVPYAIADKLINQCLVCGICNEQMSCNAIETHF